MTSDVSEEALLFADVIAGRRHIDGEGLVYSAVRGTLFGRPIGRREQDMSPLEAPPRSMTWEEIETLPGRPTGAA